MKQIITSLLLAVFSLTAHAQHHKGHSDDMRMHMRELNLSPEQQSQFNTLRQKHREQMQQLNRNDSMTVRDMRAKRKALHDQQHTEMMNMLSPSQQKKLDSLQKKDMGARSRRMHRPNRKPEQMNKPDLKKELSLNDEQVQKLKSIQEKDRAEMQAIQKDSSISEANKKIRLAEIKKQRRKELEELLTPEQQKKYKEMQGPRGKPGNIQ